MKTVSRGCSEWVVYGKKGFSEGRLAGSLRGLSAIGFAGSGSFFRSAGYRHRDLGALTSVGSNGYAWSSALSGTTARLVEFHGTYAVDGTSHRSNGFTVRCVQALTNWFPEVLFFPSAGYRIRETGALTNVGSYGCCWLDSASEVSAYRMVFSGVDACFHSTACAFGYSLRCVQAFTCSVAEQPSSRLRGTGITRREC